MVVGSHAGPERAFHHVRDVNHRRVTFGENITSTGADFDGASLDDTRCVESTAPAVASITVTESPASDMSGLTVLVINTRLIPL